MVIAQKRIPVKEDTWEELGDMKKAGQTYDDLIEELIDEHKKARLFRDIKKIRETEEFVPLEEA